MVIKITSGSSPYSTLFYDGVAQYANINIKQKTLFGYLHNDPICDAPKPGGPLTTRQPLEYKWMSGYPTPLQKIGQSLLCTGSSTQIQYLHETNPKQSNMCNIHLIRPLRPINNTHHSISKLSPIVSRVNKLLLHNIY